MAKRRGVIGEFLLFLREHKAYWLAPIIIILLLLVVFVVLGSIPSIAPFIYAF
ncbi:MAG: DUF5989 family protein [Planctomycetota bacterium]|jgi:hypothetical protein